MDCPVCGKFVANYTKCPYCGADIKHRISVKFLRVFSVLAIIIGLAILYFSAGKVQTYFKVAPDKVTKFMNFGFAGFEGVVKSVRYSQRYNSTYMTIDVKGTPITVIAYSKVAQQLYNLGLKPGSKIFVIGQIRFTGDKWKLLLMDISKVKILKKIDEKFGITAFEKAKEGEFVGIAGQIISTFDLGKGIKCVLKEEKSGKEVIVIFWKKIFNLKSQDLLNRNVKLKGKVTFYKGIKELIPLNKNDLVIYD